MTGKYVLNVDADEILYNAAFSVEQTAYKLITSSDKIFDYGTQYTRVQIVENLKEQQKFIHLDYELETYKIPLGPLNFALAAIKNIIKNLERIGSVKLFLTSNDQSNFRFKIAKTPGPNGLGYKAGRPTRPIYYEQCREYLLKKGAEEVFGIEADDALGIHQTDNTVAVHIDKDINRIAGKHLNWKTGERYIVTQPGKLWLDEKRKLRGCGNIWFFAQMLAGDRVDNIPSLGRFGDVEIYNLLSPCKTELECYEIVLTCYENYYGKGYKDVLYEMADLLYILDECFPPHRNGFIPGHIYLEDFND